MASIWDRLKNVAYTAVTGKNRNMPSAESAVAGNLQQQGNKIVAPKAPSVNARQLQQALQTPQGSTSFGRTLNNSLANGDNKTEHLKAYKQMRMSDLHARYKAGQIGQKSYQSGVDALLNNTFSGNLPDPVQTDSPLQKVASGAAQVATPFVNVAKTGVEGARANVAQLTGNKMAQDAAMTRYNNALSQSFIGGPASRLVNYAVGSTFGKGQEELNQKLAESIAQNDITAQNAYRKNPERTLKNLQGSNGQTLSNLDFEARARGRQTSPQGGVLTGAEFGLDVGTLGLGTVGKQAVKMGVTPVLARLTENGMQGALGTVIATYLQNPDFNPASKEGAKLAGVGFATGALAGEAIPLATRAYASMPNLAQELKNNSPQGIAHVRLLADDPSYSALAVEHAQTRTAIENAQSKGIAPNQSLIDRVAGIETAMADYRARFQQTGSINPKTNGSMPKNPLANDTPQVGKTDPRYGTLEDFKAKYSAGFDGINRLKTDNNGTEYWGKDLMLNKQTRGKRFNSTEELYNYLTTEKSQALTSPSKPKKLSNKGQSTKSPKVVLKSPSGNVIPQNVKDVTDALNGKPVKERGFAKTVRTADKTPKIDAIENGTYVVKSDKERILDARQFIRDDPTKAEELALNPQTDMHVTLGNQLLDHYIATGQIDKFRTLNSGMATSGTELGRAVHAFADYNKTTPSGAVRFAEKTIKQYNKQHPDKPLSLSTDDVNGLVKKAQDIQNMAEGRERNIATQQLMRDISKLVPSTIADKAITVWKAGLLTSPRTTMRNVVGNTVHGVTEAIKDIPAALNDMLLRQRTGKRSLTMTLKGIGKGTKIGFQNSKDIMKYGFDPEDSISKYDVKKVTWGDNKVEQSLKTYTEFVFNFLGAQDKPFYHSSFARSLYDQAGAEAINAGRKGEKAFIQSLVDNPTERMKINATKDATTATFKNPNTLTDIAGKFKQTMGKTEAGKVVSEVVAPFTGVPSSIAGQIVAYSPIGLGKGIVNDIRVLSKNMPELQRQASQEIGRGVVGTGLMGIGAFLTAQGLMTGNPKDAKEAKQWELEGKQANSVLIGGKWRSINSVGPEALIVLAGSKIQSGKKNEASATEIAANLGKDFTSQTFLQGIQGPLNAVADPNRYGDSYIRGQAASVIPNIIKDTAKAFDGKQRQSNSVTDALKSGIPGLRNTLLPKQDVLGNDLKQEPTGVNAYIDLFNSKTPIKNSVVEEIGRLKDSGNDITPSALDKSVKVDGVKVDLTPQQRTELQKNIGQTTQDYWSKTISISEYKSLSATEQAKVLQNIKDDVRTAQLRRFSSQNSLGQYDPNFNGKSTLPSAKVSNILNDAFDPTDYMPREKQTSAPKVKAPKTPKIAKAKTRKVSSGKKGTKAKIAKFKLGKLKTSIKLAKMPKTGRIRISKVRTPKLSKGKSRRVKIA